MTIEGDVPTWLVEGASVPPGPFGTGTVGRVGEYKGAPTVWIDFDYGERQALSLEDGLLNLSLAIGGRDARHLDPTCNAMFAASVRRH